MGAIEATSNAAIVQLNGRVTRGSLSRRLREAPNINQTPLHGIAIKAQSAAMKNTLLHFLLDQHICEPAQGGQGIAN